MFDLEEPRRRRGRSFLPQSIAANPPVISRRSVGATDGLTMDHEPRRRLTATDARDKASECRDLARRALKPEHCAMLQDMAETWERLATNLGDGD